MVFCLIGQAPLKAEDNPSPFLHQLQEHALPLSPSTTMSFDTASPSDDPRAAAITTQLRDRMKQLKAKRIKGKVRPSAHQSKRHQALQPHNQIGQVVGDNPNVRMNAKRGTPRQMKGKRLQRAVQGLTDLQERAKHTGRKFLRNFKDQLRISDPDKDFMLYNMQTDELDRTHLRYAQMHQGLRVWPPELIVHLDPDGDVDLMSGAYVRMPRKLTLAPLVKAQEAQQTAQEAIPDGSTGKVSTPVLIIYAPNDRMPRLAWKLTVNVALDSQWLVIVDAVNGATLEVITQVLDAKVAGSDVDLFGTTRSLNVWGEGGTFFMVDTSKAMFDATSSPPQPTSTRGGIIILDAQNQPPTSNPQTLPNLLQVTSNSTTTGWLPDAVSAAFGFSETYDYFLSRHNRNSIDGQGGSITAVVRLGQNFQNAFYQNEKPDDVFWGCVTICAGTGCRGA